VKNKNFIISTVAELGGMQIVSNAEFHTTHCITSNNSRTKQVIRSLAFGAWILPFEYIKKSAQKKRWVCTISTVEAYKSLQKP